MSSKKTVLSRPRTRLYDANYNIGESYYKPALDRLDRKYSGRPLSPVRQSTPLSDIAERHARAFADEDIEISRRRAEKRIKEDNLFDSRGGRLNRATLLAENFDNDINDETAHVVKNLRDRKKVSIIDDVDLENTSNNIKSYRLLDRSEKILDSVGINDNYAQKQLDKEAAQRRRALKVTYEPEGDDLTKWTPLDDNVTSTRVSRREETVSIRGRREDGLASSSAALRAKQSRDRINDLDEEMAAIAEKQAAREARVARLRALVAETEQDSAEFEVQQARAERISARKEQKSVHF